MHIETWIGPGIRDSKKTGMLLASRETLAD